MVTVVLKGVHTVNAKGKAYHYAWRGGPRLDGLPGSPEFVRSYNDAYEARRRPDDGTLRSLVILFKAGPFDGLADSTQCNWSPWLDKISEHFGALRLAQFDRPEKIKPRIRLWRSGFADKPRTADYGMQVLSRVLGHGVETGKLGQNPCEGIGHLYSGSRADIIWTDADIKRFKEKAPPQIANAVDLAVNTGLRMGDLVAVSWSHIGDHAIVLKTRKSGGTREAIIPLHRALREALKRIPKQATTILANSRQRSWTEDGLGVSFRDAKIAAGMQKENLHFNDLRGTAATRFYLAGIEVRAIAEIMGWEEDSVDRIIRRYVARDAATKALILQIDRAAKDAKGT